jgi:hypothetical protein
MLNPVHLKDHLFETRLITNRAVLLLVLGGILLTILRRQSRETATAATQPRTDL